MARRPALLRRRPQARPRGRCGFGLIEVLVTMSLIIVSGAAILNGVVISKSAGDRAAMRSLAVAAAREVADRILATPFDEVLGRWGPGGSEGETFEVPGLGGTEPAGRVRVVLDETLTDAELGMALGMPRDLDGDGLQETTDVSATAHLLPIVVEVAYRPAGGAPERFRLPVVAVP